MNTYRNWSIVLVNISFWSTRFLVVSSSAFAIAVSYGINATGYYPLLKLDDWVSFSYYLDRGFWGSVFCIHNGHPKVLPNYFFRVLVLAPGADPFLRAQAVWLVAFINGFLIAFLATRSFERRYLGLFLICIAANTWMVAAHKLNWIMGFLDHFSVFGYLMAALGIASEHNGRWPRCLSWAAIFVGGLIATFSFSFGASIWVAAAIAAFLRERKVQLGLVWLGVGLVVTAVAFLLLPNCEGTTRGALSGLLSRVNFIAAMAFPFINIGSPFGLAIDVPHFWQFVIACIFGTSGLAVMLYLVWLLWKGRIAHSGILGLTVLMLACAGGSFLIGIGRATFDNIFEWSLAPRYLPISVAFWAALLGVIALKTEEMSRHRNAQWAGTFLVFFVVFSLSVSNTGYIFEQQWKHGFFKGVGYQLAVSADDLTVELASILQPNRPEKLIEAFPYVLEHGLDMFDEKFFDMIGKDFAGLGLEISDKRCLGAAKEVEQWRQSNSARFIGWAVDSEREPARHILFVRAGRVVGVGGRARGFWRATHESQLQAMDANRWQTYLPGLIPYYFGIHAEWVGAVNTASLQEGRATVDEIYVLSGGSVCLVK